MHTEHISRSSEVEWVTIPAHQPNIRGWMMTTDGSGASMSLGFKGQVTTSYPTAEKMQRKGEVALERAIRWVEKNCEGDSDALRWETVNYLMLCAGFTK